jgi:hypothetical protein
MVAVALTTAGVLVWAGSTLLLESRKILPGESEFLVDSKRSVRDAVTGTQKEHAAYWYPRLARCARSTGI